jgi:hypothetical protein
MSGGVDLSVTTQYDILDIAGWPPPTSELRVADAVLAAPAWARANSGHAPLSARAQRAQHSTGARTRMTPYRRWILAVTAANVGALVLHLWRGDWRIIDGSALSATSALTLVNLAGAVLIRQQTVLDVIFRVAGRGSRSWPMWLRRSVANVHQIGGIHVGCAIGGTAWMCGFASVAVGTRARHPQSITLATVVLSVCLVVLLLVVCLCASPTVRARAHNVFEQSHRWGGWTGIAMFWALTIHLALRSPDHANVVETLGSDWHVWVMLVLTASIASPWLTLRRVPITVERPSAHVAIVHLDHGVRPVYSSAVGISLSPLREWHPFATVTSPERPGYRLLISRAGDWTGRFIDDPPSHVWVRGLPVSAPMATVAGLFGRVVYVVTGSGIGPCLGQILADRVPAQLVWSTRDPVLTYGEGLVAEVAAVQPDAVIWDTTTSGKPDLLGLALDAYTAFDAEAVFIVSNKPTTFHLVDELQRRGIPAFGPIWDS